MRLLTGTVRRWNNGDVSVVARHRPGVQRGIARLPEVEILDHHYQTGDQPDAECLVIIADDPAELRRVREVLTGGGPLVDVGAVVSERDALKGVLANVLQAAQVTYQESCLHPNRCRWCDAADHNETQPDGRRKAVITHRDGCGYVAACQLAGVEP